MTVCSICEMPQAMHFGFDHKEGKCILATNMIALRLMHREKAEQVYSELEAWLASKEQVEQAAMMIGAYI